MTSLERTLRSHHPAVDIDVDVSAALDHVQARHRRTYRRRLTALSAACVLLVAGGAIAVITQRDDAGEQVATDHGSEARSIDEIVGVQWRFDGFTFSDGREPIDLTTSVTSFSLNADNTFDAALCNHIGGNWHMAIDGLVHFGDTFQTLMGCGGEIGRAERAFGELGEEPLEWTASDTELRLSGGAVTAALSRVASPFPLDIEPLADPSVQRSPSAQQNDPARPQHIIGHRTSDGGSEIVIMARATTEEEFTTLTSPSSATLEPIGLTFGEAPYQSILVATWLPQDTAKAWVVLTSGGAEINLTLKPIDGAGVAGFTSLPEPTGVIVAFDQAGNEIGRSAPFDVG